MAFDTLQDEAQELLPDAIALRRDLHRHPEVGNHLPRTRDRVLEDLDGLGLELTLHDRTSGIAGLLTGARPGRTILLRGDMDALPMPEHTGLDFASERDGTMHACGHDTHVAMLLGGAHLLVERANELPGPVLLMFQPGEEGFFGAKFMLDEGLLEGLDPARTRAFAIHISKPATGRPRSSSDSSPPSTRRISAANAPARNPVRRKSTSRASMRRAKPAETSTAGLPLVPATSGASAERRWPHCGQV